MFRFLKFRKSVKFDRELLTARLLHPDWKCAGFAPICPSVPVSPVLGPPALLCGKQKAANVFPAFISALKSTDNAKVLLQGNLSLCPSPTSFGTSHPPTLWLNKNWHILCWSFILTLKSIICINIRLKICPYPYAPPSFAFKQKTTMIFRSVRTPYRAFDACPRPGPSVQPQQFFLSS